MVLKEQKINRKHNIFVFGIDKPRLFQNMQLHPPHQNYPIYDLTYFIRACLKFILSGVLTYNLLGYQTRT